MATVSPPLPEREQAAAPRPAPRTAPLSQARLLGRLALMLLLVGVAWRTLRYFAQPPLWGDEAFICLNLLDRDYREIAQPLRYNQVAPLLFLWSEMAAYHLLGGSELALRLLPYLTGLGALVLFWRLARLTVSPLASVLAVGILAVAYYPVRHACEVKPYALDLCASLALLVAAVSWLREPGRWTWLALLTVLVPAALAASYTAVFVAGAVSVALGPAVWRCRGWAIRGLYFVYNLLLGSTFLALYWFVGRGQFVSTGGAHNPFWDAWFPPWQPWELLTWLVSVHTGNLLAYPVGGHSGGSTLTFLLVLAGVWQLCRGRRWELLLLLGMPFALTFLAAALRRYPYGGSARIAQHLAPAICLLAGTGAAALLTRWARRVREPRAFRLGVIAGCAGLALLGIAGMVRDVLRPFKTDADRQARAIVTGVFDDAGPDDQVVVLNPLGKTGPTFEWYLRQREERVSWGGRVDWKRLGNATRQVWFFDFGIDSCPPWDLAQLAPGHRDWVLLEHNAYTLQMGWSPETVEHCEVFHWACSSTDHTLLQSPACQAR